MREARKRVDLTQAQLAEASNVSDETIRRIELGKFEPALSTLAAIADALHVSVDGLLGRDVDAPELASLPPAVMRLARRAASLTPAAQLALLQVAETMPDHSSVDVAESVQHKPSPSTGQLAGAGSKKRRPQRKRPGRDR